MCDSFSRRAFLFLSISTLATFIVDQKILCCGGRPVHCKVYSSVLGLHPFFSSCDNQTWFQVSPGIPCVEGQDLLWSSHGSQTRQTPTFVILLCGLAQLHPLGQRGKPSSTAQIMSFFPFCLFFLFLGWKRTFLGQSQCLCLREVHRLFSPQNH